MLAYFVIVGLTDRFGSARLIWPAGLAVAVLPLALWSAQTLPEVTAAVLAFGIVGGFLVVALNAQGVRLELGYGRPPMASFYASYSLGGLAGALLGGLLTWRRAGLPSALGSIAAGCVTAAIIAGYRLLPEPAGFAGFSLTMAAGRPAGDRLAARFGPAGLALCVTGLAFVLDQPVVSEPVVSEPVVSGTEPGRSAGSRSR